MPRSRMPALSPACTWSSSLWNISVPVITELMLFSRSPTISTGSPFLATPRSTLPVTTVPRPLIESTSLVGPRQDVLRVHHGHLVQEDHGGGTFPLALQEHVLTRLRHRSIRSRHPQDRS